MQAISYIRYYLRKGDAGITVILVLGILAVVNFFSSEFFLRWDLTENKIHSLSSVSREAAREADDIITARVYFSRDLPNRYLKLRRDTRDLLNEYAARSEGKMKVEFIHPEEEFDEPQQELARMGIPAVQFNVLEEGSYQVSQGYMGMIIQYGSRQEVIPVIREAGDLEYRITTALKKLSRREEASIALFAETGGTDVEREMSRAREGLREIYEITETDLEGDGVTLSQAEALVIPTPSKELSAEQLRNLEEYAKNGGNIFIMADGVVLNSEEGLRARSADHNLNRFLEKLGVRIKNNLVLDEKAAEVSFSSGFMGFSTPYPFWPEITEDGFDQEERITAGLQRAAFPWVSEVEITGETEGVEIIPLVRSGENSWVQQPPFDLNPERQYRAPADSSPKNIAVKIKGAFESGRDEGGGGEIVIVGDSDFIKDRFMPSEGADNLTFFRNTVDDLSGQKELIEMRSREMSSRPLKDLEGRQKTGVKYANILSLSIVVLAAGMVRYYLRKRNKRADEQKI